MGDQSVIEVAAKYCNKGRKFSIFTIWNCLKKEYGYFNHFKSIEFVYSFVNVLKVLTAHVGGTVTGSIYYDGNLPLEMNKFIVVINEL